MDNAFGIAVVTGSLMASLSSSLKLSGNLNFRRRGQRSLYDKLLRNEALASQVGLHPSGSGPTARAYPPSWTQNYIGKKHGHVIATLSSSDDQILLNSFFSGTQKLENSKVPASSSMYYTKKSSLKRVIYSVTASALLGTGSFNGVSFDPVSGSYFNGQSSTGYYTIDVDVPDRGKIRDVRVWVEIIKPFRTPKLPVSSSILFDGFLPWLYVGLRSPNVKFNYGFPLWNDPAARDYLWGSSVDFYKNNYPLWGIGLSLDTGSYSQWSYDADMRCVFTDAAPATSNPFILSPLYNNFSQGSIATPRVLSGTSPNYVGITRYGTSTASLVPSNVGAFYPWFVDTRIGILNLASALTTSYTASAAPAGWLNGPLVGGLQTTASGEWNTSPYGNLGPAYVCPPYPIMDDVFVENRTFDAGSSTNKQIYRGFRPGLRGTQSQGKWTLLLGTVAFFFRQFRIELLIDQNEDVSIFAPSRSRKFKKTNFVPVGEFKSHAVAILSGAASLDAGTQYVYVTPPLQYGRSIGITDNTGSSNFAVYTRLTGTLISQISSSQVAGLMYSYIHNEFGTPYIPISSGSINPVGSQFIQGTNGSVSSIATSILSPDTLIDRANDMASILAREQVYSQTTVDMLDAALSGSS